MAIRNARRLLLLALFLSTTSCPADSLPSTCRPEYQKLPGGLVHTACKPPNDNCIFVTTGLSMAEKAEVLKAHNDLRSQVAQGRLPGFPTARNMYRMTQVVDSAGRVKDWFSEYKDFSAAYVDPFHVNPGPVVTHFTQVSIDGYRIPADHRRDNSVVMKNMAIASSVNLLLFTAFVPVTIVGATCRPEYQNLPSGLVHTACKPPNPNCTLIATGLSAVEKVEMLKAHNDLRSQVAQGRLSGFPTATNMYRLQYEFMAAW
ncbi:hypothetical protein HPB52_010461 [Rhipicephalus sanguineus]|uniref:Uncharacterized protein n=1 Tax=Rhipicephalus sanguineus TaxID=34632 RepID=A0A9D4Q647_RHISA|nr:hypothetical protein HPB52_010461 [Rhipicephalus sanguineus]